MARVAMKTRKARKMRLQDTIRLARQKRSLTVAEVANQVGVSAVSIYYWETGRVRPREYHLRDLCKVLKLPIRATAELA